MLFVVPPTTFVSVDLAIARSNINSTNDKRNDIVPGQGLFSGVKRYTYHGYAGWYMAR